MLPPESVPILGMDDFVQHRRVAEEVFGRVAGDTFAGGRNVDEVPVRVHPVLPVVGKIGHGPVTLFTFQQFQAFLFDQLLQMIPVLPVFPR